MLFTWVTAVFLNRGDIIDSNRAENWPYRWAVLYRTRLCHPLVGGLFYGYACDSTRKLGYLQQIFQAVLIYKTILLFNNLAANLSTPLDQLFQRNPFLLESLAYLVQRGIDSALNRLSTYFSSSGAFRSCHFLPRTRSISSLDHPITSRRNVPEMSTVRCLRSSVVVSSLAVRSLSSLTR